MKKQSIIIISIVVFVLIAVFTNPNVQIHREAVKTIFNQNLQKSIAENESVNNSELNKAGENIGILLGNVFIDKMIENIITSDNYVLFSITKLSFEGKRKIIGYGLFGNVFISNEVNKALENYPNEVSSYENTKIKNKEEDLKDLE